MIKVATEDDTVLEDQIQKTKIQKPKAEKKLVHSLLDSIKGDRVLTFNSFRYRLLHWCFGVNPKTPAESPLPKMLYTHYCPLFHLTNLIAIFSPLIFLLKVCVVSVVLTGKIFAAIGRAIAPVLVWLDGKTTTMSRTAKVRKMERKEQREVALYEARIEQQNQLQVMMKTMTTEEKKQRAKLEAQRQIPRILATNERYVRDFEYFWGSCKDNFTFLGKKHAKKYWDTYVARIKEQQAIADARREKMRAWMIFWVNFSRIFIKAVLNVTYAALFALVAYGTIFYGIPALIATGSFLAWIAAAIWSVEWLKITGIVLYVTGYALALVGTVASLIWISYKLGKRAGVPFNWMWEKTLPPRALVGGTFSAFGNYVATAFNTVVDFISLFYEENCPTITVAEAVESED